MFFFFFCLGATLGFSQGLLLGLHSWITPNELLTRPHSVWRSNPGWPHVKQTSYPLSYHSNPRMFICACSYCTVITNNAMNFQLNSWYPISSGVSSPFTYISSNFFKCFILSTFKPSYVLFQLSDIWVLPCLLIVSYFHI